jgi:hypothetical protein
MPIGKDQWDAFLAAVARNTVRRERGEQPHAPSPTCEACQGTGWVTPWFDDLGKLKMRVRCGCASPHSIFFQETFPESLSARQSP